MCAARCVRCVRVPLACSLVVPSSPPARLQFGDSPLHYASFCGHVEVARALLAAGADPNKASIDGKTPLMSAQEEGHKAVVDLFLSGTRALPCPHPRSCPRATTKRTLYKPVHLGTCAPVRLCARVQLLVQRPRRGLHWTVAAPQAAARSSQRRP
ncbi:ankyrin repeat domain-containing protein [archaeon]|nr:MAG: ankyrin repeat domain-containing protein [archaeon]